MLIGRFAFGFALVLGRFSISANPVSASPLAKFPDSVKSFPFPGAMSIVVSDLSLVGRVRSTHDLFSTSIGRALFLVVVFLGGACWCVFCLVGYREFGRLVFAVYSGGFCYSFADVVFLIPPWYRCILICKMVEKRKCSGQCSPLAVFGCAVWIICDVFSSVFGCWRYFRFIRVSVYC